MPSFIRKINDSIIKVQPYHDYQGDKWEKENSKNTNVFIKQKDVFLKLAD
jgi:hypothetical protein